MMTTMDAWLWRTLRPLPRRVRPVQNETTLSFVRRLALANHIRIDELAEYLNTRLTGGGQHRQVDVSPEALAVVSGVDVIHLVHALPQIRARFADQDSLHVVGRNANDGPVKSRLACRRCMAGRNITVEVTAWAWSDQNVCLRHQLWIGQGVNDTNDQADVADVPAIATAQIRHHNLVRRHGFRRVRGCYRIAQQVIDWSSGPGSPTARQERRHHFFDRERAEFLPWSYDYASYYPEVVGVLSVLASPFWQRMASSDDVTETLRFYRQITNNGLTNGTPALNRPLHDWVVSRRAESAAPRWERRRRVASEQLAN